jgi:DNA helicase II / ATP-dependent DNA helicase PcrA
MDAKKRLNEEQKQTVTFGEGPLLLVAGAGTGKTAVITERIAYLIKNKRAAAEEILALTFTDKAATEMEERVDGLLDYGYMDLWISTFHSFCERILKEHGLDIGLSTDFKLLDQTSAWLFVKQNLDKFQFNYYRPLGRQTKFISALISHFSRCKDQNISPEDYLEYSDRLKTNLTDLPENQEAERIKEVANAYHIYQKLLLENNFLDFGDLINYTLRLFQKRPLILKKYREKFKHILIDEFQDTNWAQYELAKILAFPKNNLTVSSDDDQSIYKFRGASFNNIIQFKKDFPKTKEISLITNYRSPQNILDLSYEFIQANNPNRLEYISKINKKLIASKKEKGVIEYLRFKDSDEEAQGVINKIAEILEQNIESNFSDFAILIRANQTANPFIGALTRAGFPYQFLASEGLYSKPIILDIISYFKILDNNEESSSVYRILNMPFLEISSNDIMKITQYCSRKTKTIYQGLEELPLIQDVSEKARSKISFILSLIEKHLKLTRHKQLSEILISFLKDSGYLNYLIKKDAQQKLDLINQFYKKIKEFEETVIYPTIKNFIEQINLEIESGQQGKLKFELEQGLDMIRIMTIHSAKGLEFKYVFLVNLVDKRFPTIQRKEPIEIPLELTKEIIPKGDVYLEEERRLFYVAMTRAQEKLFFTSADDYGGLRNKKPSRFLVETGFVKKEEVIGSKLNNRSKQQEIFKNLTPANDLIKNRTKQGIVLPSHFSFSQLAAFEKCPLQYKFAYIYKVPTKGKAVFSFGKTIHNTLYEFLKLVNGQKETNQNNLFKLKEEKNKEIKQINAKELFSAYGFEDLIEIYEKEWIDEWYESQSQKKEYHKLGKKILKNFYEKFLENKPSILKVNGKIALELPFKLKIGKYILFGRIDRIDKLKNGARIIDYKTGAFKEKLLPKDKQQLLIYQIALEDIFGLKPTELGYYYLEEGKIVSFLGSVQEKKQQKEKILKEIEKIRQSDFKPNPGWQCQFCDFRDICDFAK